MTKPLKAGDAVQVTTGRLKGKVGVILQMGDPNSHLTQSYVFVRVGSSRYWLLPSQIKPASAA